VKPASVLVSGDGETRRREFSREIKVLFSERIEAKRVARVAGASPVSLGDTRAAEAPDLSRRAVCAFKTVP
jgi:hypothetical protein